MQLPGVENTFFGGTTESVRSVRVKYLDGSVSLKCTVNTVPEFCQTGTLRFVKHTSK